MDTKPRASNGAASRSSSAAAMANKSSKRQASRNEKKHNKHRGDKESSKRKKPAELGRYGGAEVDTSDDEDLEGSQREYSQPPEIGDEVAVKCPPDPPYPEGWYTGVVTDVIVHGEEDLNASASNKGGRNYVRKSSRKIKTNFTINVEWDGGGDEEIYNPEWRLKGDAPDKQGRVSHRDAKLRPYFKYWVTRLNAMNEAEKKLGRSRAGKNTRVDPDQKVEWIQCSSPSCGKWRPLPSCMKSSAILESCNNKWFCVLNSWDEAHASCGAAQETGYMPPHQG